MDFNIDSARKHTVSVRGTLNDGSNTLVPAQYPGQGPTQTLIDNSKGIAATYTWVIRPNMINVATFGDTPLGLNYSRHARDRTLVYRHHFGPEFHCRGSAQHPDPADLQRRRYLHVD